MARMGMMIMMKNTLCLIVCLLVLSITGHAAISVNTLTTGSSGADAVSYTTASVTPTANCLVAVFIGSGLATDPPTSVNSVTGNSITYTQVATAYLQVVPSSDYYRASLWTGQSATPSAGTIVIDFNSVTQLRGSWSVVEFCGINTTGTVVQFKTGTGTNTATAPTITLDSSVGAGNATYVGYINNINADVTEEAGWAELHDATGGGSPTMRHSTYWDDAGDQSASPSNGNATTEWIGVMMEVKTASAASTCVGHISLLGVGGC